MSEALRLFGVTLLGLFFLGCLVIAPITLGFSLILGVPALLLAIWLIRHDPAELPDTSRGGAIALAIAVVAMSGCSSRCDATPTSSADLHRAG